MGCIIHTQYKFGSGSTISPLYAEMAAGLYCLRRFEIAHESTGPVTEGGEGGKL